MYICTRGRQYSIRCSSYGVKVSPKSLKRTAAEACSPSSGPGSQAHKLLCCSVVNLSQVKARIHSRSRPDGEESTSRAGGKLELLLQISLPSGPPKIGLQEVICLFPCPRGRRTSKAAVPELDASTEETKRSHISIGVYFLSVRQNPFRVVKRKNRQQNQRFHEPRSLFSSLASRRALVSQAEQAPAASPRIRRW